MPEIPDFTVEDVETFKKTATLLRATADLMETEEFSLEQLGIAGLAVTFANDAMFQIAKKAIEMKETLNNLPE